MCTVQEQPVNNDSEYKDLSSKVEELMAKINNIKVQHQEKSENTTPSKPKGTIKKESHYERYDKDGYPVIYCHTHGIIRELIHVSMECKFRGDTQKKRISPFQPEPNQTL